MKVTWQASHRPGRGHRTEDRQHAYVALTHGTDASHAYVFTASPKRADPVPGPRLAP